MIIDDRPERFSALEKKMFWMLTAAKSPPSSGGGLCLLWRATTGVEHYVAVVRKTGSARRTMTPETLGSGIDVLHGDLLHVNEKGHPIQLSRLLGKEDREERLVVLGIQHQMRKKILQLAEVKRMLRAAVVMTAVGVGVIVLLTTSVAAMAVHFALENDTHIATSIMMMMRNAGVHHDNCTRESDEYFPDQLSHITSIRLKARGLIPHTLSLQKYNFFCR